MSLINNRNHFLHEKISYIKSTSITPNIFESYFDQLGFPYSDELWDLEHSTFNWNQVNNHHQFIFDYENNILEIQNWLNNSELVRHEHLYAYIDGADPVVELLTNEFILNWEDFNAASEWQGLWAITTNGELLIEFTDDWCHFLNTNFEVKPNSKKNANK